MALSSNGVCKPSFRKSYSIEYGYKPRKRTLIADAEFDREQHGEEHHKHPHTNHIGQDKEECSYTILVKIKDKNSASMLNLVNKFHRDGLKLHHMETRPTVSSSTENQTPDGTKCLFSHSKLEYYSVYYRFRSGCLYGSSMYGYNYG